MLLLQELETQKAKLEQMLLEARQEREHLKAAVTQEVPIIKPPEVPVHDQEISSVSSGPATEVGTTVVLLSRCLLLSASHYDLILVDGRILLHDRYSHHI